VEAQPAAGESGAVQEEQRAAASGAPQRDGTPSTSIVRASTAGAADVLVVTRTSPSAVDGAKTPTTLLTSTS